MDGRLDAAKEDATESLGGVTGNQRLQAEEAAEVSATRAKREAKEIMREVAGSLKEGIGKLTGDKAAEAAGRAERLHEKSEQTG